MTNPFRVYATRNFSGIDMFLVRDAGRGEVEVAVGFETVKFPEGSLFPQQSLRLSDDRAQALMEDLWNCGFRPSAGRQSEGMTAAQQKHLDDLRAIAFHALKIGK